MIKIIWGLAFFFLTLFFLFFSILIISRIYKNIQHNRRKKIKKELSEPISEYLFDENLQETFSNNSYRPIQKIFGKKYRKNSFSRAVLRKEIFRLHESYSGEIKQKLEDLFIVFGFEKDLSKKLRSSIWHIKANAICDAAQMNIKDEANYIFNLINHSNPIVRTEARVACVRLNKKNPFYFFNKIKYDMSDFDEIRILDALMEYSVLEIPPMGNWLESTNESVVVFSLKIIGYYIQDTETLKVLGLLNSDSEKIKTQAIKTLGELGSKKSLSSLFECLKKEKKNKKMTIHVLESLKMIGIFDSDVPKLLECLKKYDYEIIFAACLVIKTAPDGVAILKKLCENSDKEVVKIIEYAIYY
ncbi:MAG: HEAT repeat domain-containing protein [Bacteroidota bacterium]